MGERNASAVDAVTARYDAIVLGLGGMGSSAAFALAKRGARVVGIEQFAPAHALGSSHGLARVIRQAYHEHPAYVPLLQRAYALWEELQSRTSEPIWQIIGGVTAGLPSAGAVAGALEAARRYDLTLETMSPREARSRFPAIQPYDDELVVYEPTVGALFPEACVMANVRAAIDCGATLRFGERVVSWTAETAASVRLASDETIVADQLVVTAGPWLTVLGDPWPVTLERNTQHWFAARGNAGPGDVPVFMVEREAYGRLFYGFPDLGAGLKIAFHKTGRTFGDPALLDRTVDAEEIDAARTALGDWLPGLVGAHLRSSACTYTMTPDEHFIIGRHPRAPAAVIAGGFSGHGFKFVSVVGEIVADLVVDRATALPIELFDPRRFHELPA